MLMIQNVLQIRLLLVGIVKKGFARSTLLKELCANVLANEFGLGENCYIVATSFHIAVVLFSLFILTLFIIIFYRGQ